jgi:Tol biopolymer transport system component
MTMRWFPTRRARLAAIGAVVVLAGTGAAPATGMLRATTVRVSVTSTGQEADGPSFIGSAVGTFSANGRFVVFSSLATNLSPLDENGPHSGDVYVRDRDADRDGVYDEAGAVTTEIMNLGLFREDADGAFSPAISGNGRFVVFLTRGTLPGDRNDQPDVYLRDRLLQQTERVSLPPAGALRDPGADSGPAISANGRFVAFGAGTSAGDHVFVRDLARGVTVLVDRATGGAPADLTSAEPELSADGRFVVFTSLADNLWPGDRNGWEDVFVRDRDTDRDGIYDEPGAVRTTRISLSTSGVEGNLPSGGGCVSADGRYVAFTSLASNLVARDTNGVEDVFLRDRDADHDGVFDEPGAVRTSRVSVGAARQANGLSTRCAVSRRGAFIAFLSDASNLVAGDTNGQFDVFVRSRATHETTRVDLAADGSQITYRPYAPGVPGPNFAMSPDARYVAFTTAGTDVISGDTNATQDVFVRGPLR